MSMTPAERRLQQSAASLTRWAAEPDRAAAMAPLRDGFLRKLADRIDPDRRLPPEELARRVEMARRAHLANAARLAVKARRERAAARKTP